MGGSNDEYGYGIAVDGFGNAYVTGQTSSADYPTANAYYPNLWGRTNAFVTKLDTQGQGPIYSTYLGGSYDESGEEVAVDAAGNAYIVGFTTSNDFPTENARYPNLLGGSDAFVTKLDARGQGPIYSTYLGGSRSEVATAITLDGEKNAYVAGWTTSTDFDTINALYPNYVGDYDAFVTKFDSQGQGPVYSSYLGGTGVDQASGIAVDWTGNIYVTGYTESANFPMANALYPTPDRGFVTKFNPQGQRLVYSTYLNGNWGGGKGIVADGAGNAYVTSYNGHARVTKLDANGQGPVYYFDLGGTTIVEEGAGIAVDSAGSAYVVGCTSMSGFRAFLAKLNPQGSGLVIIQPPRFGSAAIRRRAPVAAVRPGLCAAGARPRRGTARVRRRACGRSR